MLRVIVAPMFGGKSTALARHIERLERAKKRVVLFVPNTDVRYDAAGSSLGTHSGLRRDAIGLDPSKSLLATTFIHESAMTEADAICVDEGNFFVGLREFVDLMVDVAGKTVIVAGLALDSERKPFGDMLSVMSVADVVEHLTAVCECGQDALFTARRHEFDDIKTQTLIGGSEKFIALCRKCYHTY